MMEWMLLPLKRYADFDGRSRRKEFWMFLLLNVIVYAIIGGLIISSLGADFILSDDPADIDGFNPIGILGMILAAIWVLGTFIPNIAVAVRRFHDRDMSGWWYLGVVVLGQIPVIGLFVYIGFLVFMALPGTPGPNRFGDDPTGENTAEVFS